MQNIILQPTEIAHWHAIVNEAQVITECQLDDEVESYLVYLLMRFHTYPELSESVLAMDFLEATNAKGQHRINILQQLGDKSLILEGFFPEQRQRKNVNSTYFVDMGRNAYESVALFNKEALKPLFMALSAAFLKMAEILNSIKQLPNDSAHYAS